VSNAVNDGLDRAEGGVARLAEADKFTTDAILLSCKFKGDMHGLEKLMDGADSVIKVTVVNEEVDVTEVERH
jgi:hypothetical protein